MSRRFLRSLALSIGLTVTACAAIILWFPAFAFGSPPFTNYCSMIARDIVGKKHGMLCGTTMYYCGGIAGDKYNIIESETIGFTHPFFDDERSRGYGIVEDETGSGHDGEGWDFYRHVRVAYGTVIIGDHRFATPSPVELIWRPDRQITRYEVGGVTITETKFISLKNVLCDVISSSAPIEIEFEGQSFFKDDFTIHSSAEVSYRAAKNALAIQESGTSKAWPHFHNGEMKTGRMMYDGLTFALAASEKLENCSIIRTESSGQIKYAFRTKCENNKPLILAYAAANTPDDALNLSTATIDAAQDEMQAKTAFMNRLLNEQIPYFRCSDKSVVDTYYYLWSLYFLYFRDAGGKWALEPHTMTAINNYRSLFAFDSYVYIPMGSWVADKQRWGNGNCTNWCIMLPFRKGNLLPECFGNDWHSPTYVNVTGHAAGTWKIYQHSGDQEFLKKVYPLYRALYWDDLGFQWGMEVNLADSLMKMASELELSDDSKHWQSMRADAVASFRRGWDGSPLNFYSLKPGEPKDIWNITSLNSDAMEDEWAQSLSQQWIMNSDVGYFGDVPLRIRAADSPQLPPFNVATLPTYLVIEGLFKHNVEKDAVTCTLGQLHGMVRDYGFPIAPEAWDTNYKPWGSMYVAWDAAMVLPLIERIAGVSYSVVNDRFDVNDHLPSAWNSLEIQVPIVVNGTSHWTTVIVNRSDEATSIKKEVQVKDCPLKYLGIKPWDDGHAIQSVRTTPETTDLESNRSRHEFVASESASVKLILDKQELAK